MLACAVAADKLFGFWNLAVIDWLLDQGADAHQVMYIPNLPIQSYNDDSRYFMYPDKLYTTPFIGILYQLTYESLGHPGEVFRQLLLKMISHAESHKSLFTGQVMWGLEMLPRFLNDKHNLIFEGNGLGLFYNYIESLAFIWRDSTIIKRLANHPRSKEAYLNICIITKYVGSLQIAKAINKDTSGTLFSLAKKVSNKSDENLLNAAIETAWAEETEVGNVEDYVQCLRTEGLYPSIEEANRLRDSFLPVLRPKIEEQFPEYTQLRNA